jgi:DNA repair exonuclease SbcCD ATPase subunit
MTQDIIDKYQRVQADLQGLQGDINSLSSQVVAYSKELEKVKVLKSLNDDAVKYMKLALPLITSTSTGNFIDICSKVLTTVFGVPVEVRFDSNDITIISPDGESSLKNGNGGGYKMVVSFIATIFMILKTNSRRFIVFDEAFTQLDDEALERFMQVVRGFCHELNFDILLVTHDPRIESAWVDNNLLISNGSIVNVKSNYGTESN